MAEKTKNSGYIHILIFYGLIFSLFIYILITQGNLPRESSYSFRNSEVFDDNWTLITDRETSIIDLPGQYDILPGETISITKKLPEDMKDYNTLLLWNTGKDFKVYIEDELIFTYDENNIHKIGKDRPYIYVWIAIPQGSDGKEIRIDLTSVKEVDADYIGWVYLGERSSIILTLITPFQFEIVISIVVFIMSITCIIGGIIIQKNIYREEPLIYMGIAAGMASLWIFANSKMRQFFFPNVSSIRNVAFLVVPFLSLALLFYLDVAQGKRYHKIYNALEDVGFITIILVFLLHITNILGLSESFNISIIFCGLMIFVCFLNIINEFRNKQYKEYLWSTIGILIFGAFTVAQIISYKAVDSIVSNGIYMLLGLFFLVLFAMINSFIRVKRVRQEKNEALKRIKVISSEAIETIARTVDAKDKYTSKHSIRVAAYSVELAKLAGFNESELEKLKFGALLHDIGKIGIPDAVLNKPSKLTDEEYAQIQKHTVIGADIMMQMGSVPGVDHIARYHHERFDGKGYPKGLKGDEIPKEARIVCIADSYDAMNSRRVYRANMTKEIIREELTKGRGTQFDPELLDLFIEMFDTGKLDDIEKTLEREELAKNNENFCKQLNV